MFQIVIPLLFKAIESLFGDLLKLRGVIIVGAVLCGFVCRGCHCFLHSVCVCFSQKLLLCLLTVGDARKGNGNAEVIYVNFTCFKLYTDNLSLCSQSKMLPVPEYLHLIFGGLLCLPLCRKVGILRRN